MLIFHTFGSFHFKHYKVQQCNIIFQLNTEECGCIDWAELKIRQHLQELAGDHCYQAKLERAG